MADRKLRFLLSAQDQGASQTLGAVASKGEQAGHRISAGFSKIGTVIGGEVGAAISEVGDKLENFGKGHRFEAVGAAAVGLGGVLTALGSSEQQATQQLDNAIKNTGHSADEFEGQIEKTVGSMEHFGHSAVDTKQSLQTLVNATHDPQQALNLMGEAADLAASKHISLTSAATQLARVVGGHGARTLAAYNIELVKNADGTTNWAATNQKLAQILHGQASAAADTFTGRLKALRTEVEDNVAAFGQKYGPAIMTAGIAMTTLGPLLSKGGSALAGLAGRFRGVGVAATEGAAATAVADEEIVAANERAAASGNALGASAARSRLGMVGMAGGMALAGAAAYAGGKALDGYIRKNDVFSQVTQHLQGDLGNLSTALVNSSGHTEEAAKQWLNGELAANGLGERLAKAGVTIDQASKAIAGGKDTLIPFVGQLHKAGKISDETTAALVMLGSGYAKTVAGAHEATTATESHSSALQTEASRLGVSVSALQKAKAAQDSNKASAKQATLQMILENDATGLLSQALNKLNGSTLDVEQANIAFRNSEQQVTDAVKSNGHSLSDNTQKGRDNRTAILASITAAQQHAQAIATQTHNLGRATDAYRTDIGALRSHLYALGLNKAEVDALIRRYGAMPHLKTTIVRLNDQASAKARQIAYDLAQIQSKQVTVSIATYNSTRGGASGQVRAFAGGTDYAPGGEAVVAEREAEVIVPRGAKVKPVSRMPGSGHATYNITITLPQISPSSGIQLGRAVAAELERYLNAGGKIRGLN